MSMFNENLLRTALAQGVPVGAQCVRVGEAEAAAKQFRSLEARGLITKEQCGELLSSLPPMLADGTGGSAPVWRVVARVLEMNSVRGDGQRDNAQERERQINSGHAQQIASGVGPGQETINPCCRRSTEGH